MKKVITAIFISFFFAFNASAESISEKISDLINNFLPGEGVTDVSIQVHEEDNPDIEIYQSRLKKIIYGQDPIISFVKNLRLKKLSFMGTLPRKMLSIILIE